MAMWWERLGEKLMKSTGKEKLGAELLQRSRETPGMFQLPRDLRSTGTLPELTELGRGEGSIATQNKGYLSRSLHPNMIEWAENNWDPDMLYKRYGFLEKNLPISVIDALNARGGAVPAYFRAYEDIANRGGYNISEGLTPINAARRTPTMLSYGLRDPERLKHIIIEPSQNIHPQAFHEMSPEEKIGTLAMRDLENVRRHAPGELSMAIASPEDIPIYAKYIRQRVTPQNMVDPRAAIGEGSLRRGALLDYMSRGEEPPKVLLDKAFYAKGGLACACGH